MVVPGRKFPSFIPDLGMGEPQFFPVERHVRQISKSIGIGERPMLPPALFIITSLFVIWPATVTILTGKNPSFPIDFHVESIAPTFRKDFENFCLRMIPPDRLTAKSDVFRHGRTDIGGGCTPLSTVDPAVRSPAKAVCHR